MTKTPLILLAMSLAGGCVVYDEQLVYDDPAGVPGQADTGTDPLDLPDDDDLIDALAYLEPDAGAIGDLVIVSLQGEVEPSSIQGLRFFGPSELRVTSTMVRDDELLFTVDLAGGCGGVAPAAGAYDLLVELGDGTAVFVTGAFEVTGGAQ